MSEAKHTPGPWNIEGPKKMTTTGSTLIVLDAGRYPAAFVPAWDTPGPDEEYAAEEARANASLIAAAPDLLESLKAILAACESDCGIPDHNDGDDEPVGGGLDHEGNPDPMALTFGHMRRASQAIAKAEGRS